MKNLNSSTRITSSNRKGFPGARTLSGLGLGVALLFGVAQPTMADQRHAQHRHVDPVVKVDREVKRDINRAVRQIKRATHGLQPVAHRGDRRHRNDSRYRDHQHRDRGSRWNGRRAHKEPLNFRQWQRRLARQGYPPRSLKPKRYKRYVRAFYREHGYPQRGYAYRHQRGNWYAGNDRYDHGLRSCNDRSHRH